MTPSLSLPICHCFPSASSIDKSSFGGLNAGNEGWLTAIFGSEVAAKQIISRCHAPRARTAFTTNASPNLADPIFPPEIEHLIFTHALAQQDLVPFPFNLIFVAKRVHHWLTPKLYETICIGKEKATEYPIKWDRAKLEKYGRFTRNLFLWALEPELALLFLTSCPNVTNLLFWVAMNPDLMNAISRLRLTRLSINLQAIRNLTPGLIESFSTITHLEFHGRVNPDLGYITHFTSLTHLAISYFYVTYRAILPVVFDRFPDLQAVISLNLLRLRERGVSVVEENSDLDDIRVVRTTVGLDSVVEAWLGDIKHGQGIWGSADETITRRRREREEAGRLGDLLSS
ncbi:hypothetical protein BDN72DRAFT_966040 [Pluteus cervinus]|uniref:Uncharacterized protein n=1 Tax=Pluteus cervinus TaxID=181527 RepID=A0ACD3A162_9AGAR|nr:hypothetical protein BDN72DRAFT_966040 [Pluteus cervinus]